MKIEVVLLYGRRNVAMYALSYLLASGYTVKVMSDDNDVLWLAERFGCEIIENGAWDKMGDFDCMLCVHGDKYIPQKYLQVDKMINIHPCLSLYRGSNPVKKYIENKNTMGSVESHYMTGIIDDGEVIHQEFFDTGEVKSYAEFYNQAVPFYYKLFDKTLHKLIG
jgi:methionyl-tRNA formyltransferase